jgi:hypothetical protein
MPCGSIVGARQGRPGTKPSLEEIDVCEV